LAAAILLSQNCLHAASLLHIRVLEGQGAIHTAGSRSGRGISVEITDETGRPVDGAAVSFRLPEEGAGGTFAHGMRTEIVMTGPDGRAGFREFVAGRATGPFQVRVTAVRDSVRAGTVVDQYIAEPVTSATKTKSLTATGQKSGVSKRWLVWLAIGGGAAAAGIAAGASGGPHTTTIQTVSVTAAPPSVGTPLITIGRPQ
jgi:hypothetical protein